MNIVALFDFVVVVVVDGGVVAVHVGLRFVSTHVRRVLQLITKEYRIDSRLNAHHATAQFHMTYLFQSL